MSSLAMTLTSSLTKSIEAELHLNEDGSLAMALPPWAHQAKLYHFMRSALVEGFLVALIFVSLICIIIETDRSAINLEPLLAVDALNYIVLGIYSIELVFNIYVYRTNFFLYPWTLLDLAIVAIDYGVIILEAAGGAGFSSKFLRVLRLARLTRSARVIRYFPSLTQMVQGLWATLRIVSTGAVVLFCAVLLLGVMGVHLLHPINMRVAEKGLYDGCERCPRAFESTFSSAMTFVQQIVTGDSWGLVSLPIIEEEPAALFFIGFVFFVLNFMVMNLIFSMVVDSSLKASAEDTKRALRDKEVQRAQQAETMKKLCADLDEDKSGLLTKAELLGGFESQPEFKEMMTLMDFNKEDIDAVFSILDKDGSGDVNYDEFVNELYKMKSHDSHTMLVFIKFYVTEIKDLMTSMVQREFDQLNRAVGVHDSLASGTLVTKKNPPEVEEKANLVPTAGKRDSVHDLLLEIKKSLHSDVSQMVHDLATKMQKMEDDHSVLVSHLHGRGQPRDVGGGPAVSLRAPPAPYGVPEPMVDEDRKSAPTIPPERQSGPMCHYVGRGKVEAIQRDRGAKMWEQPHQPEPEGAPTPRSGGRPRAAFSPDLRSKC